MPSTSVRVRNRSSRVMSLLLDCGLFAERIIDSCVILAWKARAKRTDGGYRVLIAGPGNGSIGDEAMYEAYLTASPDPVVVIARARADLLADPAGFGARVVYLPGLLNGGIRGHVAALRQFIRLALPARSVSVIGADTMDGKYGVRPSVRRFRVPGVSSRLGVPSRVLGFSWNDNPHPAARRALRQTPESVTLFGRDPISVRRLVADGAISAVEATDLAFLVTPVPLPPTDSVTGWLSCQGSRPIVLINANPRLVERFPDQSEAIVDLVDALLDDDFACIVLPHDARGGEESEVAYLQKLFAGHRSEALFLVDRVLLPPQVAWVASHADLTVSGRMHLVILSAVGGTPAVGFDYQGKFQGLYENLGYDLRVPAGSLSDRLRSIVFDALKSHQQLRDALQQSMPRIRDLAQRNISATTVESEARTAR